MRLTVLGARSAEGEILDWATPARESPLASHPRAGATQGRQARDHHPDEHRARRGGGGPAPDLAHRAPGEGRGRRDRWERVAREAAKQSGRAVVPEIAAPLGLAAWLAARDPAGLLVCLWERETAPLAERLPAARPARATLVVGPEGGLADEEVAGLEAAGLSRGWAPAC